MNKKVAAFVLVLAFVPCRWSAGQPAAAAKLGTSLETLLDAYEEGGEAVVKSAAGERGLKLKPGSRGALLAVIVEPRRPGGAKAVNLLKLQALGATVDAASGSFLRVLVSARDLKRLATHPDIALIRAPTLAKELSVGLGPNVSESVSLTGAADFQNAGMTGAGVKVAVVDLGFVGLNNAIAQGELPASTVGVDLSGTGLQTDTAHGVGVAEHVMDMAPGATLYCIKVGDEVDLENAADYCRDHGIRVANHSVGWVNASYYDDTGPINAIINRSRDTDGVFWAVAAGNDAESHWRGGWSDSDADNKLNFTSTDELMNLTTASGSACIFLNWDQYGNSATDLDLYIRDKNNSIIASSVGYQNGPQEPAEAVCFGYLGSLAPYKIEVRRYAGPTAGLDITLFSFYNDLEYAVAASSLMDPADAHGAYAAGAIDQADWNLAAPPPEPYSSQGPTNDGRAKPDIAAPDGTTSLTYGNQGSFGTSFSSPTVAGAAALLLDQDPLRSAADVAGELTSAALDIGASGADPVFGAGKLRLILEPNTPPVAVDDGGITDEDAAVTVSVLANDSDPDGDPLAVTAVTQGSNGSVAVDAGGTVTYTPALNFNGTDSFTYTIGDGKGGQAAASVAVTVNPVNDPPVAAAQSVTTGQDTPVAITLAASDPEGDAFSYSILAGPSSGALSGAAPDLTYTPNPGFIGDDSFTFSASDGVLESNSATVSITVRDLTPAVIASDGFESGNFSGGSGWLAAWTKTGDAAVRSDAGPHSGTYHARLRRSNGYLVRSVNLSGATGVRLRFWAKVNSFEGSDSAAVKISPDGVTFTTVRTFTSAQSDNAYHFYDLDLSGFAMTAAFRIAFDANMSATNDHWYVDDIEVFGVR